MKPGGAILLALGLALVAGPPTAADGSDWRADVRELVEDGMDTHDVVGVGVRAADRGTFAPYAIPLGFFPFRPAVLEEIELSFERTAGEDVVLACAPDGRTLPAGVRIKPTPPTSTWKTCVGAARPTASRAWRSSTAGRSGNSSRRWPARRPCYRRKPAPSTATA